MIDLKDVKRFLQENPNRIFDEHSETHSVLASYLSDVLGVQVRVFIDCYDYIKDGRKHGEVFSKEVTVFNRNIYAFYPNGLLKGRDILGAGLL